MAQPIFVIGRRRSGTKWLSNILANNRDVACIQGRRSGILETGIFDRFPDLFGDLRIDCNYYAFLACYSKSDFFCLSGMPEKELYSLQVRDYFGLFREIMDRYAESRRRRHWVQKSKSYLLPELFKRFPDAKYVIIRRAMLDNLRSSIGLRMAHAPGGRPALGAVVSNLLSYHHHVKTEKAFAARENVIVVRFEDLKSDGVATTRKVCDFLGIEFEPAMLEVGYERNTSYKGNVRKEQTLRPVDHLTIAALDPLFRNLPLSLLDGAFQRRSRRPLAFEAPRFHESYFSLLRKVNRPTGEEGPLPSP
jgi:hypothetical protein